MCFGEESNVTTAIKIPIVATEKPVFACVTNRTIDEIKMIVEITNPLLSVIADSGDGSCEISTV